MEVAKAWLSNPEYRRHIGDQIAEILRTFLEIKENIFNKKSQEEREYKYCPLCGETVNKFETDDLYVESLRCINQHTFNFRGSLWMFVDIDVLLELYQSMNYGILIKCAEKTLTNKHFKKNVPDQVRELFLYFMEEGDGKRGRRE